MPVDICVQMFKLIKIKFGAESKETYTNLHIFSKRRRANMYIQEYYDHKN